MTKLIISPLQADPTIKYFFFLKKIFKNLLLKNIMKTMKQRLAFMFILFTVISFTTLIIRLAFLINHQIIPFL